MFEADQIARCYIACWNETDAQSRRALIAALWCEDGSYVDPMMQATGVGAIDGMIAAVQERFAGLQFTLVGTPEAHNDRLRFCWSLGAAGAAPLAFGTDFAVVTADGKLASVTGFLDAMPKAA